MADFDSSTAKASVAKALMSSPVQTILSTSTVDQAQQALLRYGHTGLCVVNADQVLVGLISRRDIDIAIRHGLGYIPVQCCMSVQIKSISPETSIYEIQHLMMTYGIGRLPVLVDRHLVGIVTRTDVLRQLHRLHQPADLSPDPPPAERLYRQLKCHLLHAWPALMEVASAADEKGWALYIVGGAVRDLLLDLIGQPESATVSVVRSLTDIDLVVDVANGALNQGENDSVGMTLAEIIHTSHPQVRVQVHGQFQTASLVWPLPDGAVAEPLRLDIATARTEFYPYPAANPEVEISTIQQDLYRRDFTINAMALRINGEQLGYLLDFFGGWLDLQQRHIRVLHANSFIEDPTRIFRAARFAARLGFSLEAQTKRFVRYAVNSGIYQRMRISEAKTPGLQVRLKAELKSLLRADQWETALAQVADLGALTCLHSTLIMTPVLWRQLRRVSRWMAKLEARLTVNQPLWLLRLELILAQLTPPASREVAIQLDLASSSLHRLSHLHQWETDLHQKLPNALKPSRLYRLLHRYDPAALLLMSDRHPYTLGPQIWQYIAQLSQMPALINGDTLKQLGYPPGPQFRNILATLYERTLDGELTSTQAAEKYVLAHYPLNTQID